MCQTPVISKTMLFFNYSPLFQLDFDVGIVIFIYCYSIYFKWIMFPQDIYTNSECQGVIIYTKYLLCKQDLLSISF